MPTRKAEPVVIVTCEHASNAIPSPWNALFRPGELRDHRAHDRGALQLARDLSRAARAPLFAASASRLLVDLNRSTHHPRLFSGRIRGLPEAERAEILERCYRPHREAVERWIADRLEAAAVVVHVASHSFTPELDGIRRKADVGLLYDPRRRRERALCARWHAELTKATRLRVRRNYPYRGAADGFPTFLRTRFGSRYLGIELEVNQAWVTRRASWRGLRQTLCGTFQAALGLSP